MDLCEREYFERTIALVSCYTRCYTDGRHRVTPIYHITHVQNLSSILERGGLLSDAKTEQSGIESVGIAHQHIKQRRARRSVPVCRRGTLADYVPFYFAPRSPMLYAIHRGAVEGYDDGQRSILHLTSTAELVVQSGLPFAFTEGHAEIAFSEFFDDLESLKIGYPLHSGNPNILWLGSRGLGVPVGDDRSIRRWVHGDCLLHKAVEEFSPAA